MTDLALPLSSLALTRLDSVPEAAAGSLVVSQVSISLLLLAVAPVAMVKPICSNSCLALSPVVRDVPTPKLSNTEAIFSHL